MRSIGIDEAINRIAERTVETRQTLKKSRFQRRTEFPDNYGVPFYAESQYIDGRHRARFYISVPPKYTYLLRFQFKLYVSTLATSDDGNFEVSVQGVDITDLLIEQQDMEWIEGEGLYPSNELEDDEDFFDILDAANVLYSLGDEDSVADSDKILKPGFKRMEISADAEFSCTMYLYTRYGREGS